MKKNFTHINLYSSDVDPQRFNTIEFVLEDNKLKNFLLLHFGEIGAVSNSRFDENKIVYTPKTPNDFIKLLKQTQYDYTNNCYKLVDVYPACLLAHDYKNKKMTFLKDTLESGFDGLMDFAITYFKSNPYGTVYTGQDFDKFRAICNQELKKQQLISEHMRNNSSYSEEDQL